MPSRAGDGGSLTPLSWNKTLMGLELLDSAMGTHPKTRLTAAKAHRHREQPCRLETAETQKQRHRIPSEGHREPDGCRRPERHPETHAELVQGPRNKDQKLMKSTFASRNLREDSSNLAFNGPDLFTQSMASGPDLPGLRARVRPGRWQGGRGWCRGLGFPARRSRPRSAPQPAPRAIAHPGGGRWHCSGPLRG